MAETPPTPETEADDLFAPEECRAGGNGHGAAPAATVLLELTAEDKLQVVREHNESHGPRFALATTPRTPLTRRYMVHPGDVPALRSLPQGAHVLAAGYDRRGTFARIGRRDEIPLEIGDSSQGMSGLPVTNGRIYQEYNEDIQSLSDRMIVFEEMRRSEPAFAACEWLISIPLAHTPYWFEPGDRKDPRCVKFAEFLNWNLSDGLTRSFAETAREAAMGIFYGFTWVYPRYEFKEFGGDVYTGWRQFAPRARATVDEWKFDDDGGLRGLVQCGTVPTTGETKYIDYGIEEIIIWTWRGDNGDPEGLGAYRQAYKPYSYLSAFEEFAAIRVERQSCGIPIAVGPLGGYDTNDEAVILAILNNIRAGHDAGFVVPDGWEIKMLDLGAADVPFGDHIERQRRNIMKTVGAQFVELSQGTSGGGSNALSRDSSSTFYDGLNYMASWITEAVNTYAVPRIMQRNLRELTGDAQPKLRHGRVGVRDLERYMRALELPFRERTQMPPAVVASFAREAGISETEVLEWMEQMEARRETERQAAATPSGGGGNDGDKED